MSNLLSEWITIGVDTEAWRNLPNLRVSWADLNRCGGPLPVRVRTDSSFFEPDNPDGKLMLVQPVYAGPIPSILDDDIGSTDPCLVDLIAYSPRHSDRWYWRRGECALVLGDEVLARAEYFHEPVRLFGTPWAWLRAGGRGVCLLDRHPNALERLRYVGAVNTDVLRLCEEMQRLLRTTRPTVPRINVVVRQAAAA